MDNILLYAKKNLIKKWTSSIVMAIITAIVFACIIAVFAAGDSLSTTYKEALINTYGEQEAIIFDVRGNSLPQDKLLKIGETKVFGIMSLKKNINENVAIGYMDEATLSMFRIKLVEGEMPQNENQIVLEQSILKEFSNEIVVGSSVTLEYNSLNENNFFNVYTKKDYVISGIIENYSTVRSDIQIPRAGYEQLPSIIVGSVPKTQSFFITHRSIIFNGNDEIQNDLLLNTFYEDNTISTNRMRYNVDMLTNTDNIIVNTIKILICISSCIILGAVFFLYVLGDEESVKKMYVLGATRTQLYTMIFLKCLFILFISIIIGAPIALGIFSVLTRVLENVFYITYTATISIKTMTLALLIYMGTSIFIIMVITVLSTVKIVREKTPMFTKKTLVNSKHPYFLSAYKSILTHFNKFVLVTLIMIVCISVFCVSFAVKDGFINELDRPFCDFSLEFNLQVFAGPLMIPAQEKDGFSKKELEPLIENSNIKQIYLTKTACVNFVADDKTDNAVRQLFTHSKIKPFSTSEKDIQEMTDARSKYAYSENQELYRTTVKSADLTVFEAFKNFTVIGNVNVNELKKGTEIIICISEDTYDTSLNCLIDKEMHFSQIYDYNPKKDIGVRRDFVFRVAGIVIVPPQEELYKNAFSLSGGIEFLCSSEAFDNIFGSQFYQGVYIQLYNQDDTQKLINVIKSIKADNPQGEYISKTEVRQAIKKINNIVNVVMTTIIFVFGLFAFLLMIMSYVLSLNQKIGLMKRLYCIGMNINELNLMIIYEYVIYLISSIIVALPITLFFALLITEKTSVIITMLFRFGIVSTFFIVLIFAFAIFNRYWIQKNIIKN